MTSESKEQRTRTFAVEALAVSLLWAGMVLGVSFLATPAKFLIASLALPVALEVGHYTFEVFNRVEIGWGVVLIGILLLQRPAARWLYVIAAVPCGIVAFSALWLLPRLAASTAPIIAGGTVLSFDLHLLYMALEMVKLIALLALAFWSLRYLYRAASAPAVLPKEPSGSPKTAPQHEPVALPKGGGQVLSFEQRRRQRQGSARKR